MRMKQTLLTSANRYREFPCSSATTRADEWHKVFVFEEEWARWDCTATRARS